MKLARFRQSTVRFAACVALIVLLVAVAAVLLPESSPKPNPADWTGRPVLQGVLETGVEIAQPGFLVSVRGRDCRYLGRLEKGAPLSKGGIRSWILQAAGVDRTSWSIRFTRRLGAGGTMVEIDENFPIGPTLDLALLRSGTELRLWPGAAQLVPWEARQATRFPS
jgi:hypothetical protein